MDFQRGKKTDKTSETETVPAKTPSADPVEASEEARGAAALSVTRPSSSSDSAEERGATPKSETGYRSDSENSSMDKIDDVCGRLAEVSHRLRVERINFSDDLFSANAGSLPTYHDLGHILMIMSEMTVILLQVGIASQQHSELEEERRRAARLSLQTLADRPQISSQECSVESCLAQFTHAELLTGSNKFACPHCNKQARRAAGGE